MVSDLIIHTLHIMINPYIFTLYSDPYLSPCAECGAQLGPSPHRCRTCKRAVCAALVCQGNPGPTVDETTGTYWCSEHTPAPRPRGYRNRVGSVVTDDGRLQLASTPPTPDGGWGSEEEDGEVREEEEEEGGPAEEEGVIIHDPYEDAIVHDALTGV